MDAFIHTWKSGLPADRHVMPSAKQTHDLDAEPPGAQLRPPRLWVALAALLFAKLHSLSVRRGDAANSPSGED